MAGPEILGHVENAKNVNKINSGWQRRKGQAPGRTHTHTHTRQKAEGAERTTRATKATTATMAAGKISF